MRIGEVASRAGLSTSAIRFYEAEGLLPRASRTTGGYRDYDSAAVARLSFIARAKEIGFSLPEIRQLLDGDRTSDPAIRELVSRKIRDVGLQMRSARQVEARLYALRDALRPGRGSGQLSRLMLAAEEVIATKPRPQTPSVLSAGLEEATRLGHQWLGAEHLLLALLRPRGDVALLLRQKIRLARARASVMKMVGKGSGASSEITLTPRVHSILGIARGMALAHDGTPDDLDLLLGLIEGGDSVATEVLRSYDVDLASLRVRLLARYPAARPPGASPRGRGTALARTGSAGRSRRSGRSGASRA